MQGKNMGHICPIGRSRVNCLIKSLYLPWCYHILIAAVFKALRSSNAAESCHNRELSCNVSITYNISLSYDRPSVS